MDKKGKETGDISTGGRVRIPPPAPEPNPPLFSLPEDNQVIRGGTYEVKASLNKFTDLISVSRNLRARKIYLFYKV